MCRTCGKNRTQRTGSAGLSGSRLVVRYYDECRACRRAAGKLNVSPRGTARRSYRRHLGASCERCGFVAVDPIQLDVHHRDHNHGNNALENLATLCANCHRLEHRAQPVAVTA